MEVEEEEEVEGKKLRVSFSVSNQSIPNSVAAADQRRPNFLILSFFLPFQFSLSLSFYHYSTIYYGMCIMLCCTNNHHHMPNGITR